MRFLAGSCPATSEDDAVVFSSMECSPQNLTPSFVVKLQYLFLVINKKWHWRGRLGTGGGGAI